MLHRLVLVRADVSVECIISIMIVTRIGQLGITSAATSIEARCEAVPNSWVPNSRVPNSWVPNSWVPYFQTYVSTYLIPQKRSLQFREFSSAQNCYCCISERINAKYFILQKLNKYLLKDFVEFNENRFWMVRFLTDIHNQKLQEICRERCGGICEVLFETKVTFHLNCVHIILQLASIDQCQS